MSVGSCLNQRRIDAGLSIDELARKMGFAGQSSIQRYLTPEYDLELRPDMARKFDEALGNRLKSLKENAYAPQNVALGIGPSDALQVLRTILCAHPTAGQIIAALAANGLEIVSSAERLASLSEIPDDPLDIIREILARRKISANLLATSCGLSPSTLNRALNNPQHKFMLSTRTLKKIRDWDAS